MLAVMACVNLVFPSLLENTAQPEKRDIFMKNGNESRMYSATHESVTVACGQR